MSQAVVLRVIDTPGGQSQLRYRVSAANFGVGEINDLSATVLARFLEASGLSADTKFVERQTADAAYSLVRSVEGGAPPFLSCLPCRKQARAGQARIRPVLRFVRR